MHTEIPFVYFTTYTFDIISFGFDERNVCMAHIHYIKQLSGVY